MFCHGVKQNLSLTWWRHQMEIFSVLLTICEGNPLVTSGFPSQRPVTWNFNVFIHLCLNKRLSKQSRCQWLEMLSCSLWCHCNVWHVYIHVIMSTYYIHYHTLYICSAWWCQNVEMLSALLALCEGNPLVISRFSSQRSGNGELWCLCCKPWTNSRMVGEIRCHDAHVTSL